MLLSETNPRDKQWTCLLYTSDAADVLSKLNPKAPLIIWNSDTIINGAPAGIPKGAWLLVAEQLESHFSFARVENDQVLETAEKVRISPLATAGLYGFAEIEQYLNLVKNEIKIRKIEDKSEMYVAPLYNKLIADGVKVTALQIPTKAMQSVGTPDEVRIVCAKRDWSIPEELH